MKRCAPLLIEGLVRIGDTEVTVARIRLTLTSSLFDEDEQVSIRENLLARILVTEICKEYNLSGGNYVLRNQSTNQIIDPDKTLEQLSVQTGAVLVFSDERRIAARAPLVANTDAHRAITGSVRAFVRELSSGQNFEILWQPAVIGRPKAGDPGSADKLAVNLEPFDGSKTVSRDHARILEQSGQYYLEPIVDNNPTALNGGVVRFGERRLLMPGDKITVGKFTLEFGTKSRQAEPDFSTMVPR